MTPSSGSCRIDAVDLGEVEINLLHPAPILNARYAFTHSASGTRFGMGNKNRDWSEETLAKLAELRALMEADIAADLFEQAPTVAERVTALDDTSDGVPGL